MAIKRLFFFWSSRRPVSGLLDDFGQFQYEHKYDQIWLQNMAKSKLSFSPHISSYFTHISHYRTPYDLCTRRRWRSACGTRRKFAPCGRSAARHRRARIGRWRTHRRRTSESCEPQAGGPSTMRAGARRSERACPRCVSEQNLWCIECTPQVFAALPLWASSQVDKEYPSRAGAHTLQSPTIQCQRAEHPRDLPPKHVQPRHRPPRRRPRSRGGAATIRM